jgi:aarF domain-containing kinase
MAGKRLLDLAVLFNASRGVAQKHVALRSRQVEVYNRTSTIARAVRSQTDRVTETVKAASFLASRLNETSPLWTAEASEPTVANSKKDGQSIPSEQPTERSPVSKPQSPLGEGQFFEESANNSVVDPSPAKDLEIRQEKQVRDGLPDGTIPTIQPDPNGRKEDQEAASRILDDEMLKENSRQESMKQQLSTSSTVLISARKPQLPNHTSNIQGDGGLAGQINSYKFYQPLGLGAIPAGQTIPEQDEVPEGVDTALFYNPRIAKLLGGGTQGANKADWKSERARDISIHHTGLAAEHIQPAPHARSPQKHPLDPSRLTSSISPLSEQIILTEEVKDLAHDPSKELGPERDKVTLITPSTGPD